MCVVCPCVCMCLYLSTSKGSLSQEMMETYFQVSLTIFKLQVAFANSLYLGF